MVLDIAGSKTYGCKTDGCPEGFTCRGSSGICKNSWCNEGCRWCKDRRSSSCHDSSSNCGHLNKTGTKGCFQAALEITWRCSAATSPVSVWGVIWLYLKFLYRNLDFKTMYNPSEIKEMVVFEIFWIVTLWEADVLTIWNKIYHWFIPNKIVLMLLSLWWPSNSAV